MGVSHAPGSAQRIDAEPRSGSTFQPRDPKGRAKRGAEAPGQRAPLRRLLQRVRRFVPRALLLRIWWVARRFALAKNFAQDSRGDLDITLTDFWTCEYGTSKRIDQLFYQCLAVAGRERVPQRVAWTTVRADLICRPGGCRDSGAQGLAKLVGAEFQLCYALF